MRDRPQDQATGLRQLFARDALQAVSVRGSGDCDGTAVAVELAGALVTLGHRPLVVDLEGAQAAIRLGLKPRYELAHVLRGDKALAEVLLTTSEGIAVLPAMRGLQRAAAGGCWRETLSDVLRRNSRSFNVWLLNGVVPGVTDAESPLLVVAPTRAAITDAYAQIKMLAQDHGHREFRIVVDRAASESAAHSTYASIAEACRRFLAARLIYGGYLPHDGRSGSTAGTEMFAGQTISTSQRAHAFSRLAEAVVSALPGHPAPSELNMGR